jgi:hypothetical protein
MVIESPFLHQRDRAALVGLGRHVADHHAPGAAGEAAVGDQADRLAQALADQRAEVGASISGMPGPPLGPR